MNTEFHPNVDAQPITLRLLGDFVLVKRDPDAERSRLIIDPNWKKNPDPKPRRGTVVAVGPGDKIAVFLCGICPHLERRVVDWNTSGLALRKGIGPCPSCGAAETYWDLVEPIEHAPMHVQPGDEILYHRAPANDVQIGGEHYVLLHEGQHIVAVLDKEAA